LSLFLLQIFADEPMLTSWYAT